MNTLQSIQNLPVIFWQNQAVITTDSLASVYETNATNIQDNFRKNAERFIQGKHFFKIEGEALKKLKDSLTGNFPVSRQTKHLILWTEQGTVRHAKMLNTEKAWEVQDQLEQFYFSKKAEADDQQPETPAEAITLETVKQLIQQALKNNQPAPLPSKHSSADRKLPVNVAFSESDLVYVLQTNGYTVYKA